MLATIPAGGFVMGTDDPRGYAADGEGPPHAVELGPYRIGVHTVTNRDFAEFVGATAHSTTAEELGTSFVFSPTTSRRRAPSPPLPGGGRCTVRTGATQRVPGPR
jgi:sulfatase modifying factor 1